MDSRAPPKLPRATHLVTAVESPEFSLLRRSLFRSSVVGLDAEWKPSSRREEAAISTPSFPTVTLLQIACRTRRGPSDLTRVQEEEEGEGAEGEPAEHEPRVFVVDLLAVPPDALWGMLRDVFVSPHVLKLGFRFKQDLVYLSSTFASQGCHPGFDRVEPFLDITSIYHHLKDATGRKLPKETKSLATICNELLGIRLSKELQCSDWSCRPLTKEQISYAAADAYYLLEIFNMFQCKFISEGNFFNVMDSYSPGVTLGLKDLFEKSNVCESVLKIKFCEASDMVRSSGYTLLTNHAAVASSSSMSYRGTVPMDVPLLKMVTIYGERILLKESDRKPGTSKRKGKRQTPVNSKQKDQSEINGSWQGPPSWDPSIGGDGCPKFLCDVMVEGLARHLRCVGVDAAIPSSKKPEPRQLIDQAHKENRVLLTRDAKLLKHQYLIRNQVYRVKNLIKNDQLLEVIETFQLKISEEQLMSRCTKCNGRFIQKPLTIEEAIAASRGFQVIPNCLFDRDLEFWQCLDCNQLYWEGTQYHNAVQKFINVCKLND